jgi:hypothetical protein
MVLACQENLVFGLFASAAFLLPTPASPGS